MLEQKREKILVYSILLVVSIGLASAILTEVKLWPFVKYDMYSNTLKDFNFVASVEGIKEDKSSFSLKNNHFNNNGSFVGFPLFFSFIFQASMEPEARKKLVSKLCQVYYNLYTSRRNQKLHDGPKILGLRIYLKSWQNLKDPAQINLPEKEELVYEEYFN